MAAPTPAELADAAKCFTCLQADHREAVNTYLLAVIAGGSTDPGTLLAQAAALGYTSMQPDHQKALDNYLLASILYP